MDGMGMLLKGMGVDPEQIKKAAGQVQEVAKAFEQRLISIENKLDKILAYISEEETPTEQKGLTNGTGSSLEN